MMFRMLIQKYSIPYYIYIYITAVINIIYWIFLITIIKYTLYIYNTIVLSYMILTV